MISNSSKEIPRYILITGAHRSGTTWVGEVLRKSRRYCYLYEPMNNRGKCIDSPILRQYEAVHLDKSSDLRQVEFYTYLKKYLKFSLESFYQKIVRSDNLSQAFRSSGREILKLFKSKMIIKDPLALLSAEWIYRKFSPKTIVVIRHPAAFVESHLSRGWRFSFEHLLSQDELKEDMEVYQREIGNLSDDESDCIPRAAIWWKILYRKVLDYRDKYDNDENWIFVRHEDLLRNPVDEFRAIYRQIGVPFDKRTQAFINRSTNGQPDTPNSASRDAQSLIGKWQRNLSGSQISLIRDITLPVASAFYDEEDWRIEELSSQIVV